MRVVPAMRAIALAIAATLVTGSAAAQDPPCFYREEPFFQPSFVTDLAFSGQQLLAGISPDAPHVTARYGQVWVYEEWGDGWRQSQILDARDLGETLFGRKLAADSIWLVSLGWPAVVIHERSGTTWSRSDTIHLPNDRRVRSLTIRDDRLLLGADGETAYVYLHSDDDWKLEAVLTAWDDSAGLFGNHVALGKNAAFVSAPRDDSFGHDTGAVYVFRYDGERWQPGAKLASPEATPADQFGRPIAATNDMLLVSAFGGGYVASYRVLPDTIQFLGYVVPRSNPNPFFADMAVSGDSVLLGWGEAREYVLKNGAWKPGRSFTPQYPGGCSVAVGQQYLAVDGPCDETPIVDEADYVCVYERTTATFVDDDPIPSAELSVFPNPTEAKTDIVYIAHETEYVSLSVHDMLGRLLVEPATGFLYPGHHTVTLDASLLPAGVYFVRLKAGRRVETRSLVVAR